MSRVIPVTLAAVACAILAATAGAALKGDPRVCPQATPGGASHHAYYCARDAAAAAVATKMATLQHVKRWYPHVDCKPAAGDVMRWSCWTFLGGDQWTATVRFRALSSGWHHTVTVTKRP